MKRSGIRNTVGAVAFITILGFGGMQLSQLPLNEAIMRVEPRGGVIAVDEYFTKHIIVETPVAVNVFQGEIHFDSDRLTVVDISYNTSIANIWAESPWYSKGDGTITFIGGTTQPGGFIGSGTLLSVTYQAVTPGRTTISIPEARILHHDGVGTEVATIHTPIDEIVATSEEELTDRTLFRMSVSGPTLSISQPTRSFDLNNDGNYTIADLSIFMSHLLTQNLRSDFNHDGVVNLTDLSMLMDAINN